MSNLAITYIRQARGFLRAGDPQRAMGLLEKARVLTGDNYEVGKQVLEVMTEACSAAGRYEQADRCRQRLRALFPPSRAEQSTGAGTITLPLARKRKWPAVIGVIVAILVLLGGAVEVTIVIMQNRIRREPVSATALTPGGPQAPTGSAGVGQSGAGASGRAAAATGPTTTAARTDKQELLKDTVGLVIVMLRYEGTASGKQVRFDIPWSTGTAFAVDPSGIMLTNRHVTEPINSPDIPPTLQDLGMPTLVLRQRSLLVCFGPNAKDRYVGKVLHESTKFDMAVVRVARRFTAALTLASAPCKQSDTVYVCGYPGIVQEALDQAAGAPARMAQIVQKWRQTGHIQSIDAFSSDSFDSTLTKGIVSAPERNINGAAYLQTDAAISLGNSGGPAINEQNEVVGIIAMGIKEGAAGTLAKYNFALLIEQLRDELDYYLQDN